MEGNRASEPAQIPTPAPTTLEMSEVTASGSERTASLLAGAGRGSRISNTAVALYGGESDEDFSAFVDSPALEYTRNASEPPLVDALGLFGEQHDSSESSENPSYWSTHSSDDDEEVGSSIAGDDLTAWSLMMEDATTAAQSSDVPWPRKGRDR